MLLYKPYLRYLSSFFKPTGKGGTVEGEGGAGIGISMSCLSCVFLCTVVGKICSDWPCTYPTHT